MIRKRNVRIVTPLREVGSRAEKILIALERYDHLDTKHLCLITGLSAKNIEVPLRQLFDAGLVDRPPNNLYRRDRLKDPQVHKRTDVGTDWLERHNLIPYRAVYRAAGGQPPHDLAVSQLLCATELEHREAGLPFFTVDEIIAKAPQETRQMKQPYRFETSNGHLIPDAIFATGYPNDEFLITFVEVNLSDHGEQKYKRKVAAYNELIFRGIYKQQLGMEQYARVLNFDNSPATMRTIIKLSEDRDPFYFKLIPEYGRFEIAPPPAVAVLDNWRTTKGRIVTLKEPPNGRNTQQTV